MAPPSKLNLRSKLEDHELDLSLMELAEVPVKEIATIPKATSLDLSNNKLTSLGTNFASSLHYLVKLDLSKNSLRELPENFGELSLLRHLDLYSNQVERLPLSFGQLSQLRWLDLKSNPLTPALREVAGNCLDAAQCQRCARQVVELMQGMQRVVRDKQDKLRKEHSEATLKNETEAVLVAPKMASSAASGLNKKEKKKSRKKGKGGGGGTRGGAGEGSKRALDGSGEEEDGESNDVAVPDACEAPITKSYAYTTGGSQGPRLRAKGSLGAGSRASQRTSGSSGWRLALKCGLFVAVLVVVAAILEPSFHREVAGEVGRAASGAWSLVPRQARVWAEKAWEVVGRLGEGAVRGVRGGVARGVDLVVGQRPVLREALCQLVDGLTWAATTTRKWVGW